VFITLLSAYQACEDDFLAFLKIILLLFSCWLGGGGGGGGDGGGSGTQKMPSSLSILINALKRGEKVHLSLSFLPQNLKRNLSILVLHINP
jgi:hypothetical protein